ATEQEEQAGGQPEPAACAPARRRRGSAGASLSGHARAPRSPSLRPLARVAQAIAAALVVPALRAVVPLLDAVEAGAVVGLARRPRGDAQGATVPPAEVAVGDGVGAAEPEPGALQPGNAEQRRP